MNPKYSTLCLWVGGAAAVLLAVFLHTSQIYPFYFMWDMDLTYVFDSVLVQSALLPDHFNHPGFGAYLIFKYSQWAAHAMGSLALLDLDSIRTSLHPIWGVVELTEYFRLHSPFAVLASILFIWAALARRFEWGMGFSLLGLALIASAPAWIYHSSMIRSELYALLFWAIAVYGAARAGSSQELRPATRWLIFTGICGGLSYLTKIQALFYLASLPVFYRLFSTWLQAQPLLISAAEERARPWALANAIALTVLVVGAAFRSVHGATFTDSYPINAVGIAAVLLPWFLYLAGKKLPHGIQRELPALHFFIGGFWLSFLLHFLLFPTQPGLSLKYMLINAKMVFFRNNYQTLGLIHYAWESFITMLAYSPVFYAALALLIGWGLWTWRGERRIAFGLLALFTLLSLSIGIRQTLRDTLWAEILPLTLGCIVLTALARESGPRRKFYQSAAGIAFGLLLSAGILQGSIMHRRLDENFTQYGWIPEKIFDGMFVGRQLEYAKISTEKYPPFSAKKAAAVESAPKAAAAKRLASFALLNQKVSLRNLSLLEKDFALSASEPLLRIQDFPAKLRGAVLIDSLSLPVSSLYLRADLVGKPDDSLDRLRIKSKGTLIAVQKRNDLKVFLYLEESEARVAWGAEAVAPSVPRIVAAGGGQKVVYVQRELPWYSEIDPAQLGNRGFFLVQPQLPL